MSTRLYLSACQIPSLPVSDKKIFANADVPRWGCLSDRRVPSLSFLSFVHFDVQRGSVNRQTSFSGRGNA